MSKKTIFTVVLQVVIIGAFVLIAAGSGTDGYAASTYSRPSYSSSSSSSSSSTSKSEALTKKACQSEGYKYIGYYTNCRSACQERGYMKGYCGAPYCHCK